MGKTFLDKFQKQTQPQAQSNIPASTPLSNKTGLNKTKTTALQQSLLGAMSSPQGMMTQNVNS